VRPRVLDGECRHLIPVPRGAGPIGEVPEVDGGCELLEGDREHDRGHLITHDLIYPAFHRRRPPDGEPMSAAEDRRKEWKPLDVVPVRVGQEDVPRDERARRLVEETATQFADPRPGIEDDRPPLGRPEFDAGGVATVAHGVRAGRRDRSPRTPEANGEGHETFLIRRQDALRAQGGERRRRTLSA